MATEIEMEKVTIEVPKAIMDFLRDQKQDIAAYLQYTITSSFNADLDNGSVFSGYSEIIKRYKMAPALKAFHTPY